MRYSKQTTNARRLVGLCFRRSAISKALAWAKNKLVELREQHLRQTESMLGVLTEILQTSTTETDAANLGECVQSVLVAHGGAAALLVQCEEITAYNSDNYLPLIWRFYSRYRSVLFQLVKSLEIESTSQDCSLMAALAFVLAHEDRRPKCLPTGDLDLSFLSDRWRKLVVEVRDGKTYLVRQQFEVCIFSYLAAELKTGDACVVGSEDYADFREQLLTWEECQPQLLDYSQQMGIAVNAPEFVQQLQTWLTSVATATDEICKDGTQVTIGFAALQSSDGVCF